MSEEKSPDLSKSWVFVNSDKKSTEDKPSGVEEIVENDSTEPHLDSDTDSISVISESGCSYRTDEEEFVHATNLESEDSSDGKSEVTEDKSEDAEDKSEDTEDKPEDTVDNLPEDNPPEVEPPEVEVVESPKPVPLNEIVGNDKYLYFATSAVCAVMLIGFSVAVQHYFYGSSDASNFNSELDQQNDFSSISHYTKNVKAPDVAVEGHSKKSYNLKRKRHSKVEDTENKIIKLPSDADFHDKIVTPDVQIQNDDLRVEGDGDSNYKLNKNKNSAIKFNKENCDDTHNRVKNDENKKKIKLNNLDEVHKNGKKSKTREGQTIDEKNPQNDDNYHKKLKELKIKEDYLREKEKFLIEKEHDLLKKEIKLKKEKDNHGKNKYEKKTYYNKVKHHRESSDEYVKEKKDRFKSHKKHDENGNPKNKKYKNKEKKYRFVHNQSTVENELHKKRNISGQWYINMHKARNYFRQREHASDWVFDRAQLRSMKRNKAHWYFQWMVDRARLRVK